MVSRNGLAPLHEHIFVLASLTKLEKHRADPPAADDYGWLIFSLVDPLLTKQVVKVLGSGSRVGIHLRHLMWRALRRACMQYSGLHERRQHP